jgi:hypothetical protein
MTKDISVIYSGLGPNPKAIGNGPINITPPKPLSDEIAAIMKEKPATIKKKPKIVMK